MNHLPSPHDRQSPAVPAAATIRPGSVWYDTKGERIQAHGGSVLKEGGVYYWYGENKEHTHGGDDVWHWGIRCYRSIDLLAWEDLGLIIPPQPDDPASPLHPARQVDRPHIIHNARTGMYVCWIKIMGEGLSQTWTCLVASELLGPYDVVATDVRPCGMSAGDFDLVVDPYEGKAYAYFERPHSELICADLDDDYTGFTGYYSTHFTGLSVPDVREAPAHFRRGNRHYLITSGTTGYFPNQSLVAVADSYHGPWRVLGDPHPGDESATSFRSQISCVFPHPLREEWFIAVADRWLPGLSPAQSDQRELFERLFVGHPEDQRLAELLQGASVGLDGVDTSVADYVWLPLRFDGDRPVIEWHDAWSLDA